MSFIDGTTPKTGRSNNAVVHCILLFSAFVLALLGGDAILR
jgi:hypothetical protein